MPHIRSLAAAWLFTGVLASGCATTVPIQTASLVPAGQLRIGGQVALSTLCGPSGVSEYDCMFRPLGTALPEVRASARYGLGDFDLGLSLHGAAHGLGGQNAGITGGVQADVKRALWTNDRWIVSGALGLGLTRAPATDITSMNALQLMVPLFVGYRTESWEWVASPRVVGVVGLDSYGSHVLTGLALAAVRRHGPWRWSVQVAYDFPPPFVVLGVMEVGVGLHFDWPLSNPPAAKTAPPSP